MCRDFLLALQWRKAALVLWIFGKHSLNSFHLAHCLKLVLKSVRNFLFFWPPVNLRLPKAGLTASRSPALKARIQAVCDIRILHRGSRLRPTSGQACARDRLFGRACTKSESELRAILEFLPGKWFRPIDRA